MRSLQVRLCKEGAFTPSGEAFKTLAYSSPEPDKALERVWQDVLSEITGPGTLWLRVPPKEFMDAQRFGALARVCFQPS